MEKRFHIWTIILLAICLLPAGILFGHTSPNAALFGLYTLRYATLLSVYTLWLVGLFWLGLFARPRLIAHLRLPLRWLHRFPIVLAVLAYALLEGWYAIRALVIARSYFGEPDSIATRLVLWAAGLLAFYLTCVLIFGAREPNDLRDTAANVGLVAASSLLAFVVFSFAYVLTIQRDEYLRAHTTWGTMQTDPDLGALAKPNIEAGHYFPETGEIVPLTTNSEGFRGAEPADNPRLAVIGDSFIFGEFVSDDEMWRAVLEQELNQPVANYSMIGINFQRYHILADVYIDPGEHDLVIYAIYANDLTIFYLPGTVYQVKGDASRRSIWFARNPVNFTFGHFFYQRSPLAQIRALVARARAEKSAPPPPDLPYDLAPICDPNGMAVGWREEARASLQADLDLAIARAGRDGYALLFVLLPSKVSVYEDVLIPACDPAAVSNLEKERDGFAFICDYLAGRGVPCYDMTSDFSTAAHATGQPLFFSVDGHWNTDGHAVFAHLLADYLRAHDLLPEEGR